MVYLPPIPIAAEITVAVATELSATFAELMTIRSNVPGKQSASHVGAVTLRTPQAATSVSSGTFRLACRSRAGLAIDTKGIGDAG